MPAPIMSDDNELGLPKCKQHQMQRIGAWLSRDREVCINASNLPRSSVNAATIVKMVKQYVHKDVKVSAETMEMLVTCCSGEKGRVITCGVDTSASQNYQCEPAYPTRVWNQLLVDHAFKTVPHTTCMPSSQRTAPISFVLVA